MSLFNSKIILSSHYSNINNMVELPYNDKERIVEYMHARFSENKMYTWVGNVLLYVQPYKNLQTRNSSTKSSTACEEDYQEYQRPSVEAVVDRVWFRLNNKIGQLDQTIIILGESGSGKTYSTYLTIKSLSKKEAVDPEGDRILRQVWASVPLLGAFGNASTSLNATSSRFGKLLRLQYNNGCLRGAMIETYLLEKTRVANVRNGEGNFHIFRQLLDSLDEDTLASLTLSKLVNYRIAPKVGLKSAFNETVKSMDLLNITEFNRILKVLAIILNLGNVEFIKNINPENASHGDCHVEKRFIVNPDHQEFLENVATLMHVRPIQLFELLCTFQISSKGPNNTDIIYTSSCTDIQECQERRDCIMKHLYEKLLFWLVNTINLRIFFGDTNEHINILDFYGFEYFEHNTFEQLCINYANERLHNYFTKQFLLSEREDLLIDGFEVDSFDAADCMERMHLIEGPISIFEILNEECNMKRFKNDLHLNRNLCQTFRLNKHFFVTDELDSYFCIRHYAGVVKYDTTTMINKNRDRIPNDIMMFLKNSGFDFIQVLLQHDNLEVAGTNRPTVLNYFKHYFDKLGILFEKADVHYIKCLKPNGFQIPEFFDKDYFTQQLYSNGVFDILKLPFQNFSIKMNIESFVREIGTTPFEILKNRLCDQIHIGKHNIFMNESSFDMFHFFTQFRLNHAARIVQKCWLRYLQKQHKAACLIQQFYRLRLLRSCFYERFNDIIKQTDNSKGMNRFCLRANTRRKIEQYLEKNRVEVNFEGEPLSLRLEKIYYQLITPKFKRYSYVGEHIVTYNNPNQGLPTGLADIL